MKAFMERWWRGRDPIVGIDLREERIVFADVGLRGGSRWLTFGTDGSNSAPRGVLGDPRVFISNLREFIARGRLRVERCAVGLPESLTYISRVTLPQTLVGRSESVRYEAALERAYLRPRDVRGRIYPLRGGEGLVLIVAATVSEIGPVEDAIRSVGIELACLTPRVVALHHLVTLSGVSAPGRRIVHCDPSVSSGHFHLFNGASYYGPIPDLQELVGERTQNGTVEMRSGNHLSLIIGGDSNKEAFLRTRCSFSRILRLSDIPLPGGLIVTPDQLVATALSLWEVQRG